MTQAKVIPPTLHFYLLGGTIQCGQQCAKPNACHKSREVYCTQILQYYWRWRTVKHAKGVNLVSWCGHACKARQQLLNTAVDA